VNLTPRQAQILPMLAAGMSNREIGERLYVSRETVKTHIAHMFARMGATSRAQAVALAYQHGLLGRTEK